MKVKTNRDFFRPARTIHKIKYLKITKFANVNRSYQYSYNRICVMRTYDARKYLYFNYFDCYFIMSKVRCDKNENNTLRTLVQCYGY